MNTLKVDKRYNEYVLTSTNSNYGMQVNKCASTNNWNDFAYNECVYRSTSTNSNYVM